MDLAGIVTLSIICSAILLALCVIIVANIFCLWQAKPIVDAQNSFDLEDAAASARPWLKWQCSKWRYHIRTYVGCFPSRKRRGRRVWKAYDYSIRRCWFSTCYCCQEMLDENENFLDEVFSPPATIIIAPATSMGEKRLESILQQNHHQGNNNNYSRSRTSTERADSGSMADFDEPSVPPTMHRGLSIPKLSILAPDPIVLPSKDYKTSPTQASIPEDTELVSFYMYQLEGKAGERMLY